MAVFSFRYDAHLVPDLLANVKPMVDGWISFDDRAGAGLFSDEPARRHALLSAARDIAARWVLAIDPDERLEARAASLLPRLTAGDDLAAYSVRIREMFAPDRYRVDGVWGRKWQYRIFRLPDGAFGPDTRALHGAWLPSDAGHKKRNTDLNLYHLKMIDPRRRAARRDLYNRLDPQLAYQSIGYDYLTDETGAVFETVTPERAYHPVHVDDGGLWMPDLRAVTT